MILKCYFCNNPYLHYSDNFGYWQDCKICGVSFDDEFHIRWERRIGKSQVVLNLYSYHNLNKTVLSAITDDYLSNIHPDIDSAGRTEIILDYCMKNVTPENVVEKMKLLLIFG
jgi:hypothetical protein